MLIMAHFDVVVIDDIECSRLTSPPVEHMDDNFSILETFWTGGVSLGDTSRSSAKSNHHLAIGGVVDWLVEACLHSS